MLEAINDTRQKIRAKVKAEMSQKQLEMADEGRYPYEGLWLTLPEIIAVQNKLKEKNIIVFFELLIGFGFLLILSYGLYKLTNWILPI